MQDEPSTSSYEPEPPRERSIPDDFIWDPERQGWLAPGEPCTWDSEADCAYIEAEWEQRREDYLRSQQSKGLNSQADLPAAGALDVPPSWRKSLRAGVKREHLPLFPDDDDTAATKAEPTPTDPAGDGSSQELP